jgi:hypothetical protein
MRYYGFELDDVVLAEFLILWQLLADVHLTSEHEDDLR